MKKADDILVVGDLHGRHDLLAKVLAQVLPAQPAGTRLVFLGDYIDRGPGSRQVLEDLLALRRERPETVLLMGNHERMLLEAMQGRLVRVFLQNGGLDTLRSYGLDWDRRDELPASHLACLGSLPLMHQTDSHIFVHAGLRPGVPLDQQDEHDILWIREEFFELAADFGKTVVFGHTPFARPLLARGRIGIDTGAVYGGHLTCLKLPEETFIEVR